MEIFDSTPKPNHWTDAQERAYQGILAGPKYELADPAPERVERPAAPAGWYAHPSMVNTKRYWDGQGWTDHITPVGALPQSAPQRPRESQQQAQLVTVALLAASVVGAIMALQSASLLTGTGTQWTGAAIAIAAGIASYVLRKSIPGWLRAVCVVAAVLALANVIYLEQQLEEKRSDLHEIFN
jgi:hypothetical protein